ncbi:MAG: TetR/AcrR family transcriptional regulator [Actinomycetota bacterium]|nr:TetR/AcrR family transcriptional regulator [Actinomycetota bacterium]
MTTTPEARAQRTRLPRGARRAQLLRAAQDVFVAQGYHAAAMDDIAERAGVSKPVLYQHFPGKLELYLALLDEAASALVQHVHRALASTSDNKLRVQATIEAYFEFVDHEAGAFRLVFESDLMNELAVRERVEQVTTRCARAVSELIAEDAGLDPEEAMLLAVGAVGMAQVAARYWLSTKGSIPRREAARLVATLSWRGIRGFPRAGEPPSSAQA